MAITVWYPLRSIPWGCYPVLNPDIGCPVSSVEFCSPQRLTDDCHYVLQLTNCGLNDCLQKTDYDWILTRVNCLDVSLKVAFYYRGVVGLLVSSSLLLILGWSLPRRCDTAHVVYRDPAENNPAWRQTNWWSQRYVLLKYAVWVSCSVAITAYSNSPLIGRALRPRRWPCNQLKRLTVVSRKRLPAKEKLSPTGG